ncbi:MAG: hypothetical protein OEX12_11830 [Gammaproteobacteria bacterium]|nr:hypothetical protein [Gammaproteobacteria bacterium]
MTQTVNQPKLKLVTGTHTMTEPNNNNQSDPRSGIPKGAVVAVVPQLLLAAILSIMVAFVGWLALSSHTMAVNNGQVSVQLTGITATQQELKAVSTKLDTQLTMISIQLGDFVTKEELSAVVDRMVDNMGRNKDEIQILGKNQALIQQRIETPHNH